jgi:hypothetical protein
MFLFIDSKFDLIFFKEKTNSTVSNNCKAIDELKNLESALESKGVEGISTAIKKVTLRLTLAYALETGFSGSETNSEPVKASKLSMNLDVARKEFSKFSQLTTSEISSKISEIQESVRSVKESLKDYC